MKGSKGTLIRGFGTGQVSAQPHPRTSSSRNGNEDWVLDHARGLHPSNRWPQRDIDTIIQSAPGHPVRGSRNMKGAQPFACI